MREVSWSNTTPAIINYEWLIIDNKLLIIYYLLSAAAACVKHCAAACCLPFLYIIYDWLFFVFIFLFI
jgi:hypothetical protein